MIRTNREEKIIAVLKQAEASMKVSELVRKHGIERRFIQPASRYRTRPGPDGTLPLTLYSRVVGPIER